MAARQVTIDWRKVQDLQLHKSGVLRDRGDLVDGRPRTAEGKLLTPKQIRARARRRSEKRIHSTRSPEIMTKQEFEHLYKPVEEWDMDELAHGRPRDINGGFAGAKPKWITRQVHEEAMERFTLAIKTEMGVQTPTAIKTLEWVITNSEIDEKGKPMVPAAAKIQAATFLIEHIVGKPKQRVEQDISVKLQGILGSVMVNPNEALAPPSQGGRGNNSTEDEPGYSVAHLPGHTIPMGVAMEDDPDAPIDVDSWESDDE